jgi:chorismate--pyruvate lyase
LTNVRNITANLEPRWNDLQSVRRSILPQGVVDWLRDPGSLTARLKGTCPGRFRVRLLRQEWERPLYSESRVLGMRRGEVAFVREVELLCDHTPWVFARTVIPARSLRGPARHLALLGTRPLGEVLFADPRTRRGPMEIARLQPRHPLFASATAEGAESPKEIWGRRTLFHLSGAPLLVNEIFLPAIPEPAQ